MIDTYSTTGININNNNNNNSSSNTNTTTTALVQTTEPLKPQDVFLLPRWPTTKPLKLRAPKKCTPERVGRAIDLYASSDLPLDECLKRHGIQVTDFWAVHHAVQSVKLALQDARRDRAHVLVESTLRIADDTSGDVIGWRDSRGDVHSTPNMAAIKRAQLRIGQRRWLAGIAEPSYRDRPETVVDARSVTIQHMSCAVDPSDLDAMPLDTLLQMQRRIARGGDT